MAAAHPPNITGSPMDRPAHNTGKSTIGRWTWAPTKVGRDTSNCPEDSPRVAVPPSRCVPPLSRSMHDSDHVVGVHRYARGARHLHRQRQPNHQGAFFKTGQWPQDVCLSQSTVRHRLLRNDV
jgi:hypothetical protein